MTAAPVYLILTLLVCGVAVASRRCDVQKMSAVLLTCWVVSNSSVRLLGFEHAAVLTPMADTVWALYCCALIRRYPWAGYVALSFLASLLTHATYHYGAAIGMDLSAYRYYLSLNVIFMLQLVLVGYRGWSDVDWVARFSDWSTGSRAGVTQRGKK